MAKVSVSNHYDIQIQPRDFVETHKRAMEFIRADLEDSIKNEMKRLVSLPKRGNTKIIQEEHRSSVNLALDYLQNELSDLNPRKYPKLIGVSHSRRTPIGNKVAQYPPQKGGIPSRYAIVLLSVFMLAMFSLVLFFVFLV